MTGAPAPSRRVIEPFLADDWVMIRTPTGAPLAAVPWAAIKRPAAAMNWKLGLVKPSTSKVHVPNKVERGFAGHEGTSWPPLTRVAVAEIMSPLLVLTKTIEIGSAKKKSISTGR